MRPFLSEELGRSKQNAGVLRCAQNDNRTNNDTVKGNYTPAAEDDN
jgi:hypothetical protein